MNPTDSPLMKKMFYLLLILVITFSVYSPARNAKLTNWDDEEYVSKNPDITSFKKHKSRLFTEIYAGNYHPLTMLSLTYDYSIGKLNPKSYHRTNIILHLINSILVFWLVILLAKNIEIGLICGLLFGIHPLHVESVAWVSERKDVLYTLFFLSSLIAYLKYLKEDKLKFYLLALFLFILSLLSKGMAVSLSITLIAIDYLYNRKIVSKKVLIEKIPFLALSFLFGLIAIYAQPLAAEELDVFRSAPAENPFYEKLLYATYNIGHYIAKLFIPFNLAIYYPYPEKNNDMLPLQYYIVPFLMITFLITSSILILKSKNYYWRSAFFCFLFFIINIALVLQLFPIGDAIMADRYTYISSIGIFLFIGFSGKYIIERRPKMMYILMTLLVGYSVWLSYLSYNRCKVWHDSISLWTDEIAKYHHLGFPYNNRGIAKHDLKDFAGALQDYNKCIELDPSFYKAYYNKGILESTLNNYQASIKLFDKALSVNKNFPDVYPERAAAKYKFKDYKGAIQDYSFYIKSNPSNPFIYNSRGLAYFHLDDYSNALNDYNKAIELLPGYVEAYTNRGIAKSMLKDFQGAITDFNKAIEISPTYSHAYYNKGKLELYSGMGREACADLQQAAQYGLPEAVNDFNLYCK
jgi:tetratricopeptide (TPR) repeat protein